eukprot:6066673-Pyramimonas_sp.AAC.1
MCTVSFSSAILLAPHTKTGGIRRSRLKHGQTMVKRSPNTDAAFVRFDCRIGVVKMLWIIPVESQQLGSGQQTLLD